MVAWHFGVIIGVGFAIIMATLFYNMERMAHPAGFVPMGLILTLMGMMAYRGILLVRMDMATIPQLILILLGIVTFIFVIAFVVSPQTPLVLTLMFTTIAAILMGTFGGIGMADLNAEAVRQGVVSYLVIATLVTLLLAIVLNLAVRSKK